MKNNKLLEWFCCGDVGASSEAIVYVMSGLPPKMILDADWCCYPHDSSDFGRCYKLLKIFPEWRRRIKEMKCLGKIWERIADNWFALESLYDKKAYDELYDLLQKLQPGKDEENCTKITIGNGVSVAFSKKRSKSR